MALLGGCRCGSCRYTLDYTATPVTYACHCLDCQTMSGASFSLHSLVSLSRLAIAGEMIDWKHPNSAGRIVKQCFCAVCKTRLYSTNEGRPGMALVRAGTLDNSAMIAPAVHAWVKQKQAWFSLPIEAEVHDENVPPDRMMALFAHSFDRTGGF